MEAIKSDVQIDVVYLQSGIKSCGDIIESAKEKGFVIKNANAKKLDALTNGGRHGGIAALISEILYADLDDLLKVSSLKGKLPFLIMADEIEDPHNLGAVIRTAEAVGADGLIVPKRRSAAISGIVQNTSAGAASWLKICRVANLSDTIKTIKKSNIWVYGAEADGEPYHKTDFSGGVCLVIGSEGKGLGRLVRESCDKIVSIDMHGQINSLNVSVSAGILMYHILRSRDI